MYRMKFEANEDMETEYFTTARDINKPIAIRSRRWNKNTLQHETFYMTDFKSVAVDSEVKIKSGEFDLEVSPPSHRSLTVPILYPATD